MGERVGGVGFVWERVGGVGFVRAGRGHGRSISNPESKVYSCTSGIEHWLNFWMIPSTPCKPKPWSQTTTPSGAEIGGRLRSRSLTN